MRRMQVEAKDHAIVPFFDDTSDGVGHILLEQPGLPALCVHRRVTSEEGLQAGGLVPADQQLGARLRDESTNVG